MAFGFQGARSRRIRTEFVLFSNNVIRNEALEGSSSGRPLIINLGHPGAKLALHSPVFHAGYARLARRSDEEVIDGS